jgi:NAD(P)H-hydrate repair Nnr-like enzyme with NAD(P)H-hydrate epimerase domain
MKSNQISTYALFVTAARLAGDAIQAATAFQQMPDCDASEFEATLQFWHRVRDFNGTAALICAGGGENRAETLVAARLLANRSRCGNG